MQQCLHRAPAGGQAGPRLQREDAAGVHQLSPGHAQNFEHRQQMKHRRAIAKSLRILTPFSIRQMTILMKPDWRQHFYVTTFLREPFGRSDLLRLQTMPKVASTQRMLPAGAAPDAPCLMLMYGQVCHESVQRGDGGGADATAFVGHGVVPVQQRGRP